jgi:hypothetical protein
MDDSSAIARFDKCVCCKHVRTQGTFFEIVAIPLSDLYYESWEANNDVSRKAHDRACQRWAFVLDMVMTWSDGNPPEDRRLTYVAHANYPRPPEFNFACVDVQGFLMEIQSDTDLMTYGSYTGAVTTLGALWKLVTRNWSPANPTRDLAL